MIRPLCHWRLMAPPPPVAPPPPPSDPVSCSRPPGDLPLPADLPSSSNQAEGQRPALLICSPSSTGTSYWPPHLDRLSLTLRASLPASLSSCLALPGSMTLEISHRCDRNGDGREEVSVQRGRLSEIDSCNATASQRKAAPAGLLLQISDYDARPRRLLSGAASSIFQSLCHGRAVIYVAGVPAYVLPLLTNPHYASEAKVIVKAEG